MRQMTLAAGNFERCGKTAWRAAFLSEMERAVQWTALCALIAAVYPKPGKGRPPVGWSGCRASIFFSTGSTSPPRRWKRRSTTRRRCAASSVIDLGREPVPDETTVCRFRHPLKRHDPGGRRLFEEVHRHLEANGLKVSTGTVVDATIIDAPSSTENAGKARGPDMHRTEKRNQWYFGMKAHVGVDSQIKISYAAVATATNVADCEILPDPLHGQETRVWGDRAYRGQSEAIKRYAPRAKDFANRRHRHRGAVDEAERARNRTESNIRAKIEPPHCTLAE